MTKQGTINKYLRSPWLAGQVIGGFIGSYVPARVRVYVVRIILIGIMVFTGFGLVTRGFEMLGLMARLPPIVQVAVFTVTLVSILNVLNPNIIFGAIFEGAKPAQIRKLSKTGDFPGAHFYFEHIRSADSWAMVFMNLGCGVGFFALIPAVIYQIMKEHTPCILRALVMGGGSWTIFFTRPLSPVILIVTVVFTCIRAETYSPRCAPGPAAVDQCSR